MKKFLFFLLIVAAVGMPMSAFASDGCEHRLTDYNGISYVDPTYHAEKYYCLYCGEHIYVNKEKHQMKWHTWYVDWSYGCLECGYTEFGASLDSVWAFKNKKYAEICIDGKISKGDLLIVKVGKKTYKKKIKTSVNGAEYKVKIKKPRRNYKIKVYAQHKGKKIYLGHDFVKTSKNPKKGMTKKQVKKYTLWGGPDYTRASSSGYSYWYYDDGSYIVFKKGRVKYWYG